MLKTSEERVRLLKKGVKIKTIEELYIRHNKIKLIQSPILFDLFENSSSNSIGSPDIPAIELKHDKITDRDPISMRTQSLYMKRGRSGGFRPTGPRDMHMGPREMHKATCADCKLFL